MIASSLRRRLQAALLLAVSLSAGDALGHPHGWVDISVRVLVDENGRMTGLHQTWRMDPFYSLVVFDELSQIEDASLEQSLDQLGSDIRDNLASQGYFTQAQLDGTPLALGDISQHTVMYRNDRLMFQFILPFAEAHRLDGKVMRYRIFDPTYWLEVVHEQADEQIAPSALTSQRLDHCRLDVELANPDPEKVLQAAMLDTDEEGPPGLGTYFAETGVVDCRASND